MRRKISKNKAKGRRNHSPPKAKVVCSNHAGCTTLPLPKQGQVIEIPQGYEIVERITFDNFEPRLMLLLRRTAPILFETYLKSRRAKVRGGNRQVTA